MHRSKIRIYSFFCLFTFFHATVSASIIGNQGHPPKILLFSASEFNHILPDIQVMQFYKLPALIKPTTFGWRYQPKMFIPNLDTENSACIIERDTRKFEYNKDCSRYI